MMKGWRTPFILCLGCALLAFAAMTSRQTNRSLSFEYEVTVEPASEIDPSTVAYACYPNNLAGTVASEIHEYRDVFNVVKSTRFQAVASGHHTTAWWGLIDDRGRDSVIFVTAQTEDGNWWVGQAELPANESEVTIELTDR